MKRKELTKTNRMISNWKKLFSLHDLKNFFLSTIVKVSCYIIFFNMDGPYVIDYLIVMEVFFA